MLDASNLPDNPSWPLRNMLLLAAVRWGVTQLSVICWRSRGGRLSAQLSLVLSVSLPPIPGGELCLFELKAKNFTLVIVSSGIGVWQLL